MFQRKEGGQWVQSGIYLQRATWEFVTVAEEGGFLPGEKGQRYARVPTGLLLIAGPLMGLLFIILLPLTGFVAILVALGRMVFLMGRGVVRALLQGAVPSWVPGAAYLLRRGRRGRQVPPKAKAPKEDLLAELEEEIRRRRGKG